MNVKLESLWPSNAATCSRVRLSYRRWTFEEERKLKKWAGKLAVPEIAQLLGRSYKSVQLKANGMGVSLVQYGERSHAAKYPDSVVEYARKLHSQGWSPRRIAAKYKWPIYLIKQWCYFQCRTNDPVVIYK